MKFFIILLACVFSIYPSSPTNQSDFQIHPIEIDGLGTMGVCKEGGLVIKGGVCELMELYFPLYYHLSPSSLSFYSPHPSSSSTHNLTFYPISPLPIHPTPISQYLLSTSQQGGTCQETMEQSQHPNTSSSWGYLILTASRQVACAACEDQALLTLPSCPIVGVWVRDNSISTNTLDYSDIILNSPLIFSSAIHFTHLTTPSTHGNNKNSGTNSNNITPKVPNISPLHPQHPSSPPSFLSLIFHPTPVHDTRSRSNSSSRHMGINPTSYSFFEVEYIPQTQGQYLHTTSTPTIGDDIPYKVDSFSFALDFSDDDKGGEGGGCEYVVGKLQPIPSSIFTPLSSSSPTPPSSHVYTMDGVLHDGSDDLLFNKEVREGESFSSISHLNEMDTPYPRKPSLIPLPHTTPPSPIKSLDPPENEEEKGKEVLGDVNRKEGLGLGLGRALEVIREQEGEIERLKERVVLLEGYLRRVNGGGMIFHEMDKRANVNLSVDKENVCNINTPTQGIEGIEGIYDPNTTSLSTISLSSHEKVERGITIIKSTPPPPSPTPYEQEGGEMGYLIHNEEDDEGKGGEGIGGYDSDSDSDSIRAIEEKYG